MQSRSGCPHSFFFNWLLYLNNYDSLLIISGTEIDDGLSGRIFTHHINHERTYISLTNDLLVQFYIHPGIERTRTFAGFALTVQRLGILFLYCDN